MSWNVRTDFPCKLLLDWMTHFSRHRVAHLPRYWHLDGGTGDIGYRSGGRNATRLNARHTDLVRNTDLAGNLARSLHGNTYLTWYWDTHLAWNLAGCLDRDLVTLSLHGLLTVRS